MQTSPQVTPDFFDDIPQGYRWSRVQGYEVTSKGDHRFSAFGARLSDGRTIETWYQCDVKGYAPGGKDWKVGKGKPPLDPSKDMYQEYLKLWWRWAANNQDLLDELEIKAQEHGWWLMDRFGWTPVNQAHALAEILNRRPVLVNKKTAGPAQSGVTRVYIGRGSVLGNPFPINHKRSREACIHDFRKYFRDAVLRKDVLGELDRINAIAGPVELECFCAPKACHGEVIRAALAWRMSVV